MRTMEQSWVTAAVTMSKSTLIFVRTGISLCAKQGVHMDAGHNDCFKYLIL